MVSKLALFLFLFLFCFVLKWINGILFSEVSVALSMVLLITLMARFKASLNLNSGFQSCLNTTVVAADRVTEWRGVERIRQLWDTSLSIELVGDSVRLLMPSILHNCHLDRIDTVETQNVYPIQRREMKHQMVEDLWKERKPKNENHWVRYYAESEKRRTYLQIEYIPAWSHTHHAPSAQPQ